MNVDPASWVLISVVRRGGRRVSCGDAAFHCLGLAKELPVIAAIPNYNMADNLRRLLDQQVDRFGGAVADSAGAEVARNSSRQMVRVRACRPSSGTCESTHVTVQSWRRGRPGHDRGSDGSAQLLGGDPGGGDLTVLAAGLDAGQQPRPGVGAEVLSAAARRKQQLDVGPVS